MTTALPHVGAIVLAAFASALATVPAAAQCRPPAGSHEARLLAFYEAPTAFTMPAAPERPRAGGLDIGAEAVPVPSPSAALRHPEFCYENAATDTRLAPLFGRPRLTIGLPGGFAVEASYLPSIEVAGARATLASLALSRAQGVVVGRTRLTTMLRVHGTTGRIRGAITCPRSSLQSDDAEAPCYGRVPSRDTFRPDAFGVEGALGTAARGRLAAYVGGGASWLRPRFRVGFVDAAGVADRTAVAVDLVRATAFGGVTVRLGDAIALSTQLYAVPADVTTIRFGIGYRLR